MEFKKILFFVALINFPILCISQDTRTDSLMNALLSVEDDTLKVNTLNLLADHLYGSEPIKAIEYGNEARDLAEELDFKKGLAYAIKNIGMG